MTALGFSYHSVGRGAHKTSAMASTKAAE
jgi:hypothetical protein